jgi:hypothetical protein
LVTGRKETRRRERNLKEMFELAKVVSRRLKVRDKLLEGIT